MLSILSVLTERPGVRGGHGGEVWLRPAAAGPFRRRRRLRAGAPTQSTMESLFCNGIDIQNRNKRDHVQSHVSHVKSSSVVVGAFVYICIRLYIF